MKTIIIGITDGPVVHFSSTKELKAHVDTMETKVLAPEWREAERRAIIDKIIRKKKGRK